MEYLEKWNAVIVSQLSCKARSFSRQDHNLKQPFDLVKTVEESYQLIQEIYEKDGIDLSLKMSFKTRILCLRQPGKDSTGYHNLFANARMLLKIEKRRLR